jgi:hypothetical protein
VTTRRESAEDGILTYPRSFLLRRRAAAAGNSYNCEAPQALSSQGKRGAEESQKNKGLAPLPALYAEKSTSSLNIIL